LGRGARIDAIIFIILLYQIVSDVTNIEIIRIFKSEDRLFVKK